MTNTLDRIAQNLFVESLEADVELTAEYKQDLQRTNELFSELKSNLQPDMFKKLMAYSDAKSHTAYLDSAFSFKNGFKAGIKIGIEVLK